MHMMKFIAKAGLNIFSNGIVGDLAIEVLPELARAVWKWWGTDRTEQERRADVLGVAQLAPHDARDQAERIVAQEGARYPAAVRQAVTTYLAQVPACIRCSQRRPADPSGQSLHFHLSLIGPEDLLPLMPTHMPHFRPGDRPTGIGNWELQDLLGLGGFGEVWKAHNPHLGGYVALKFCFDPHAADVLRREAALLGCVLRQGHHPGIVRVQHTYLDVEPACLQFEYVSGGDLTGLIRQWHAAASPSLQQDVIQLMKDLTDVIAFAHRLSPPVVHRDLKPANVLLEVPETTNPSGRIIPRVVDFGLGGLVHQMAGSPRFTQRASLPFTVVRGAHTPLYASPEQIRGDNPDPRDDVYALGVIWYQLLTGDLSLISLPADWHDELSERNVSEPIIRLLGKCLANRSERRPASAVVLLEELHGLACSAPQPDHVVSAPTLQVNGDLAGQVRLALRHVEHLHSQARHLAELEQDHLQALRVLEQAPEHLRDLAFHRELRSRCERLTELEKTIQMQLESMRYQGLRAFVEELIQLAPHREDMRGLLEELPDEVSPPAILTNCLGMKLVLIPAGSFLMGSPRSELERHGDEPLPHRIEIPRPFYLGMYPVTQREYSIIMNRNPSFFCHSHGGGPEHPVEQVSWHDARTFCDQLSELSTEYQARRVYRLPFEREWEYACRAGTTTPFSFGNSLSSEQANFNGKYPYGEASQGSWHKNTSTVGSYEPNAWGLYDMHGNVWEWCAEPYTQDAENEATPVEKTPRVLRGGSWFNEGGLCRSACRLRRAGTDRDFHLGFRVALEVPEGTTALK